MNSLSLIATRGKNELKTGDLAPSKAQISIYKAKLIFNFCPTSCRGPYKDSLHWTGITLQIYGEPNSRRKGYTR
jgi:hypothetical protein